MVVLDDWQKEALAHRGNLLLKTGRRVGKTTLMAIKAAERMVSEPNTSIVVCSLTEDQAQLIIMMTLDYLEKNHKKMVRKTQKYVTKNKIILTNKSQILARPVGNTGDSLRGFNANILILDEVSRFHELIMIAATPILATTGGEIWACSTPFGKQGWFYEAYKNVNQRFLVKECDTVKVFTERPISDSWTESQKAKALEFLEDERKRMSKAEFGQEYIGIFQEDLKQFFEDELISQAQQLERRKNVPMSTYYLGADIGALGEDPSIISVVEDDNNFINQREYITLRKKYTTQVTDEILRAKTLYNTKKEYIDDGGVGFGVFSELLKNPLTSKSVEAINNAQRPLVRDESRKHRILKEDLYYNMKRLLERGQLRLLKDIEIFNSFKSIQMEIDEYGKVRFTGRDSHGVESLIRAVAYTLQRKKFNNFEIQSI